MGNGSCTCSNNKTYYNNKYNINIDYESILSLEATHSSKSQREKKKNIKTKTKTKTKTKKRRLSQDFIRCVSHQSSSNSFDDEFYYKQKLPLNLGSYKFLIYIENKDIVEYFKMIISGFINNINININICSINKKQINYISNIEKIIYEMIVPQGNHKNNDLLCIGAMVFDENLKINDIKSEIVNKFGNFINESDINYLRLRHIWSIKQGIMTKAYCDNKSLKENCKYIEKNGEITDNLRICVQVIDKTEIINKRHIVLKCLYIYKDKKHNKWIYHQFKDKIFNIIKINQIEYIEILDIFQHHSFHNFNKKYLDYYIKCHPWNDIYYLNNNIFNVSSGDYILFTSDKSIITNQKNDIWI